jgi:aspartate/methionine/tyrosine aminotransferase
MSTNIVMQSESFHPYADVQDKDADLSESCAVVAVQLNGLHKRWPTWGSTLGWVAANMSSVRWYYTYSAAPKPMTARFQALFSASTGNVCDK